LIVEEHKKTMAKKEKICFICKKPSLCSSYSRIYCSEKCKLNSYIVGYTGTCGKCGRTDVKLARLGGRRAGFCFKYCYPWNTTGVSYSLDENSQRIENETEQV
jgi:hypothetical protein